MKKLLTLLLLLPTLLPAQSAYQKLFWGQMMGSCAGDLVWEKTVTEIVEGVEQTPETHVYSIDCGEGTVQRMDAEDAVKPGLDEFDFLFEYNAEGPYIKDYFDVEKNGGGLKASIKKGMEDETPLRGQTFEVDEKGLLRYAYSHIVKDTRLYFMEVEISVWFDAQGRYERHLIRTSTEPLFEGTVSTLVEGKFRK